MLRRWLLAAALLLGLFAVANTFSPSPWAAAYRCSVPWVSVFYPSRHFTPGVGPYYTYTSDHFTGSVTWGAGYDTQTCIILEVGAPTGPST